MNACTSSHVTNCAVWAGMEGFDSNTVERAGTEFVITACAVGEGNLLLCFGPVRLIYRKQRSYLGTPLFFHNHQVGAQAL